MDTRDLSSSLRRATLIAALTFAVLASATGCGATSGPKGANASADGGFDVATDRPATPKTLYTMARILANQQRFGDAEKLLIQATTRPPVYLPAFAALAELQMKRGAVDEARTTLTKAIAAAPNDALLENDLGMCFVGKKQYDAALPAFTRAVELDPTNAKLRANRAMALGMVGKYSECLAAYSTVVTPADAHHNLAILCKLRGDTERAESEFAQAEALRMPSQNSGPPNPAPEPEAPATQGRG